MRSELDVGKAIDQGRWDVYQKLVLLLVASAVTFDGLDVQILGLSIPSLMKEWGATRADFAPVLALSLLGMAAGTVLGGQIGDRFGRRVGIIGAVLWFGAITVATALVDDINTLAMLRFLAGLGLGGTLPNASALNAEMTPLRSRAFSVMLTIVCVPLGAMLGGLLAAQVLPVYGWRALFVLGGLLPIAMAVLLYFMLPESPRFLLRQPQRRGQLLQLLQRMGHAASEDTTLVSRGEADGKVSVAALFTREYRFDTATLWVASFFALLATYCVLSWLPTVLTGSGLNAAQASTGITWYNLGGVLGVFAAGLSVGRLGSRRVMLALCAGAIGTALYLRGMHIAAASADRAVLVIAVLGFFLNAAQTGMYAVAAHVYVTRIRSTGVGSAVGFGRIGAVLSSFLVPVALQWSGNAGYFTLIAASVLVSLLALALLQRHVPAGAGT